MSQTHSRTDSDSSNRTPRWVKLFGIVALILVLLLGILHFSGGHGPGSHLTSGGMGVGAPSTRMMSESGPPSGNGG